MLIQVFKYDTPVFTKSLKPLKQLPAAALAAFGLTTLLLLLLLAGPARAQKYRTAAGVRLGKNNTGLTVQHKIWEHVTLEGLVLAGPREFSGTVLLQRHFGILGPSLNYYLGAGAHLGRQQNTGPFGGLDVIIGAEYKLPFSRFVLSLDLKPTLEFGLGPAADQSRFPTAFSVRYIFVKERKDGLFRRLFKKGKN